MARRAARGCVATTSSLTADPMSSTPAVSHRRGLFVSSPLDGVLPLGTNSGVMRRISFSSSLSWQSSPPASEIGAFAVSRLRLSTVSSVISENSEVRLSVDSPPRLSVLSVSSYPPRFTSGLRARNRSAHLSSSPRTLAPLGLETDASTLRSPGWRPELDTAAAFGGSRTWSLP
jgi:hypothetical protein